MIVCNFRNNMIYTIKKPTCKSFKSKIKIAYMKPLFKNAYKR